jgi:hypothetical protein
MDRNGKRQERTERVPATAVNVTDEIATAFRAILFQALAEAADDESDLSVEVAYLGERSLAKNPTIQQQRATDQRRRAEQALR